MHSAALAEAIKAGKRAFTAAEVAARGVGSLTDDSFVRVGEVMYSPLPATVVTGPAVRDEVAKAAARINAATWVDTEALNDMLDWAQERAEAEAGMDVAGELCNWEACRVAISKARKGKGMGSDGFDGYLVRLMPEAMQRRYCAILQGVIRERQYPWEWNEWLAVLATKPGEDAKKLGRRRDLWMQCHSMKCVMRMLKREYDSVADGRVSTANAGFTVRRNAPEQTLVARIESEMAAEKRGVQCVGYCDMGTFFMSVAHEVSKAVERHKGVAPEVAAVITHLREGMTAANGGVAMPALTGRYETAYGLTEPVAILKGLGQGDLLSPVRSKMVLDVMVRVVRKMVEGRRYDSGQRVASLFFADDGRLGANDVQSLRLAFEAIWVTAQVAGLHVIVKGKSKTAWSATYWQGGQVVDVTGFEMRMPDGTVIPQLTGDERYKYLGTELRGGGEGKVMMDHTRARVVHKCKQLMGMIGRLPHATEAQMNKAMALAMAGVIGYYGRSTVITWENCVQIEGARVKALRARGYPTEPREVLYGVRG